MTHQRGGGERTIAVADSSREPHVGAAACSDEQQDHQGEQDRINPAEESRVLVPGGSVVVHAGSPRAPRSARTSPTLAGSSDGSHRIAL